MLPETCMPPKGSHAAGASATALFCHKVTFHRFKCASPQAMLLSGAPNGFPTISAHMIGLARNVREMRDQRFV